MRWEADHEWWPVKELGGPGIFEGTISVFTSTEWGISRKPEDTFVSKIPCFWLGDISAITLRRAQDKVLRTLLVFERQESWPHWGLDLEPRQHSDRVLNDVQAWWCIPVRVTCRPCDGPIPSHKYVPHYRRLRLELILNWFKQQDVITENYTVRLFYRFWREIFALDANISISVEIRSF
jgi:hypothetical protein